MGPRTSVLDICRQPSSVSVDHIKAAYLPLEFMDILPHLCHHRVLNCVSLDYVSHPIVIILMIFLCILIVSFVISNLLWQRCTSCPPSFLRGRKGGLGGETRCRDVDICLFLGTSWSFCVMILWFQMFICSTCQSAAIPIPNCFIFWASKLLSRAFISDVLNKQKQRIPLLAVTHLLRSYSEMEHLSLGWKWMILGAILHASYGECPFYCINPT